MKHAFFALLAFVCLPRLFAQAAQVPDAPHVPATLTGFVTDTDDAAIPHATVKVDGPGTSEHYTATADDGGYFKVSGIAPDTPYTVAVSSDGFATATVSALSLSAGQFLQLPPVKLKAEVVTTIDAISAEQAATEQVHHAETQRVLGVIPNFYVVYGNPPFAPLTVKLKFQLATKASTDSVTFFAAAFVAGFDQAAHNPSYVEGTKGYFQRFGARYASGASDIMLGGAILPALLHQDPRYFIQGTGTKKSRMIHAMESPFICKGDNGRPQINFSSIGGDLGAAALTNLYYPPRDRGAGVTVGNAVVTTAGRVVNALFQEFVLPKFTKRH